MCSCPFDGWLVVRRYDVRRRDPAPPLTNEIVRARYRGFDGLAWPIGTSGLTLNGGLLPETDINDARKYRSACAASDVELVCMCVAPWKHGQFVEDCPRQLCGYDYGYFMSEDSYFSSVFNEVIYGVDPDMQAFVAELNADLLFDSIQSAYALSNVRKELKSLGRHLETEEQGGEFGPVAIFSQRAGSL
jgi:hypothetical protein